MCLILFVVHILVNVCLPIFFFIFVYKLVEPDSFLTWCLYFVCLIPCGFIVQVCNAIFGYLFQKWDEKLLKSHKS